MRVGPIDKSASHPPGLGRLRLPKATKLPASKSNVGARVVTTASGRPTPEAEAGSPWLQRRQSGSLCSRGGPVPQLRGRPVLGGLFVDCYLVHLNAKS